MKPRKAIFISVGVVVLLLGLFLWIPANRNGDEVVTASVGLLMTVGGLVAFAGGVLG